MLQSEMISWLNDFVPYSRHFHDCYFDEKDGLQESRHVFLAGNRLPYRFRAGFHIAELGFGTGLNLFASLQAWQQHSVIGQLRYTSFEVAPLSTSDMRRALTPFRELLPYAESILVSLDAGKSSIVLPNIEFNLIVGDARQTLPNWIGKVDAWFLDGFAPTRNPELWEPNLLASVAACTQPKGTFATYSAAGGVRRTLQAVGFSVQRKSGFGRKRHMCVGTLGA